MARKKRVRKIKKIRPRTRQVPISSIVIKLLPYIIFAAIVFLLFKGMQNLLLHSEYFNIKEIEASSHGPVQIRASILEELSSRKNTNIFLQDIKECEYAVNRVHPEIKNVVIYRKLPDTLVVSYELREPICQVLSGYYYLVCSDGVIISMPLAHKSPHLIVVSGIRVPAIPARSTSAQFHKPLEKAISIVKDINENYHLAGDDSIVEINIYDVNNPVLFLQDKTRVELGQGSFKEKSESFKKIINELKSRNRKAKVIDLRFDDIVVVPR